MKTLICIKKMVLLNDMVHIKLVGFGIRLCEMFLLCFCSFLFFFKFHVRKGKCLYLDSSWEEKFPFSPISIQPLSARNSKLFPFIGCFTRSLAGPSPGPRAPKGGSSFQPGQGWGALPGECMWETYFAVAFFGFKKKKKGLLWSVETFISIEFKGSLLVRCIICKLSTET